MKGILGRLSGTSEAVTDKMALTFRALVEQADFSAPALDEVQEEERQKDLEEQKGGRPGHDPGTLTLRHDVHIHLPVSDDIKVYDAISRSLRENLLP